MTDMAKRYNAVWLIDGAQSVAHIPVNLQQLHSDFSSSPVTKSSGQRGLGPFTSKKTCTTSCRLGKRRQHDSQCHLRETSYSIPAKYEAGTPNIADAVGLGAALDYVNRLGLNNIAAYEHELLQYATERLCSIAACG